MFDKRHDFLANAPQSAFDGVKLIRMFEALSDEDQHAVEMNLMHITSRTWPEQCLWQHIETNGLRIDR